VLIRGATVLITGASSGIGAATARAFAQRGAARLLLLARGEAGLARAAEDARGLGAEAAIFPADLSDHAAVDRVFAAIGGAGHWPQIAVLNAGAGRWLYTEETPPEEAVAMMGAPYFAAFFVARQVLPRMLAERRGHLVLVNSPAAMGAWPGAAGYVAARHALQGFTNALRYDLHGTGVGVTSIVPGLVASEYFDRNAGAAERQPGIGRRLLRRLPPEEVADALVAAVARDRREVVLPLMLRAIFAANRLAPWLVAWLIRETGWKRQAKVP
jgi:short-subunit dehydrogenase